MLTALVSLLLTSSPASAFAQPHLDDDCADLRRLELSPPVLLPPRVCVSPGVLTGFIFDHPVQVELQDEVRFVEVTRGRGGIAFIPPRDLLPGEQLRLTADLQTGGTRQSLTFILVAHPGEGSHQVNVHYNERTWQDMSDALSQSLLANKRLSEEKAILEEELNRTRAQLSQPTGLCGAWVGGQLSLTGIVSRLLASPQESVGTLEALRVVSYRGRTTLAVEVQLKNRSQEPWSLEKATLLNEHGEILEALRFRQAEDPLLDEHFTVFVEFAPRDIPLGRTTLTLAAGARELSLPNVFFPVATK